MTSVGAGDITCREKALRSLDRLPPFSPMLNRLMASMAKENVSFSELADLIEKDTVLAGNVLRLVNSALYGFQGTVSSARHAVAILGLNKLRNVGLSLSIARMWTHVRTPSGWSTSRFSLHSVATGILADMVAQQLNVPYPEGAFIAGLLHDLGKLLIAIALPTEYGAIRGLAESGARSFLECETEVIGVTHADLSGMALGRWNLPAPIQRAVTFHHAPELAAHGQLHLSHVVQAADQLANELGHSTVPMPVQVPLSGEILEGLGIGARVPVLLEHFQNEFGALQEMF